MIIIKTLKDLSDLKVSEKLNQSYYEYVKQHFDDVTTTISNQEDIPVDEVLESFGYIVILEKGDNCNDLTCLGFERGLLEASLEFVNYIELSDIKIFQLFASMNNSFGLSIFSQVGIHEEEIEMFLADNSDIHRDLNSPT